MSKYLLRVQINREGLEGLMREGFAERVKYSRALVEQYGGTLESYYFAYGEDDLFAIVDMPEEALAIATSLAVTRGGLGRVTTTPLITPEEMDAAVARLPEYRPPGQ